MLISFSVENFFSIKNESTLNLIASNGKELRDSHVFTPKLKNGVKSFDLLRSAVIYGPNASGKSNFFGALGTMERIVRDSNKGFKGLPIVPFILNKETAKSPTTFEAIIVADGIRYQYGFSATGERIHAEWLFAFPRGKTQKWFERDYNEEKKEDVYSYGDALKGRKKAWEELTGSNALFLTTATHYKGEQLKPIHDWFVKNTDFISANGVPPSVSLEYCNKNGNKEIIAFLKSTDFFIEDIKVKEEEFSPEVFPKDTPESVATFLTSQMKDTKRFDAETRHKTEEGEFVNMPLHWESDGTQHMLSLAVPFLEALKNGNVLIVDELNQRLHPHLMQYLIELFNDPKTNPKNAQLIFTTHAVSLLKPDIFRRDQIWFCERDENQASTLFPLTDFKPRKELEDFENYYMSGRYGALPIIRDFSDFIPEKIQ